MQYKNNIWTKARFFCIRVHYDFIGIHEYASWWTCVAYFAELYPMVRTSCTHVYSFSLCESNFCEIQWYLMVHRIELQYDGLLQWNRLECMYKYVRSLAQFAEFVVSVNYLLQYIHFY